MKESEKILFTHSDVEIVIPSYIIISKSLQPLGQPLGDLGSQDFVIPFPFAYLILHETRYPADLA